MVVHHRLRLLAFPTRASLPRNTLPLADHEISRFPVMERLHMPSSSTTPGRADACDGAPVRIAFRNA
jgi:hypothetical protein